jgi:hypothetical protein
MPEVQFFSEETLPLPLRWQILSGMRATWPEDYGTHRPRWISRPEFHPTYIVLVEDGFVLAHTVAIWKELTHADVRYMVYGLSIVFTYPDCRGQGHGLAVVRAGTDYIGRQPDGDVAMLFCQPRLQAFYERSDWQAMPDATTLVTLPDGGHVTTGEVLMMRFLSDKGRRGRSAFATIPILFGDTTW